jgi:hypothetical protein
MNRICFRFSRKKCRRKSASFEVRCKSMQSMGAQPLPSRCRPPGSARAAPRAANIPVGPCATGAPSESRPAGLRFEHPARGRVGSRTPLSHPRPLPLHPPYHRRPRHREREAGGAAGAAQPSHRGVGNAESRVAPALSAAGTEHVRPATQLSSARGRRRCSCWAPPPPARA